MRILLLISLIPYLSFSKPLTNSLEMKLVPIQAGSFQMGSPENEKGHQKDETQREVSITKSFHISSTEITQKQWHDLMGTTFSDLINQQRGPAGRGAKLNSKASAVGPKQPMCFVNWHDAIAFCQKLTAAEQKSGTLAPDQHYTLPTEAQWEYACRAGTTTAFSIGNIFTSNDANFYGKLPYGTQEQGAFLEKTTPVSSFKPNAWGLYDMHGNVYEWCFDWYSENPKIRRDPPGPKQGDGRIIRGGAWDRKALSCRSAYRYSRDPNRRSHNIGFRIILISKE